MAEKINRPRHDQLFKYLMADLSFSREFLKFILPEEKFEELEISRLMLTKSSYIDDKLSENLADVVIKIPYKEAGEEHANLIIIFEHKSYKDDRLPFQLLRYLSNGYLDQFINSVPRTPIMLVIFYHGKDHWDLKKIREGFSAIHASNLRFVPDFDWIFINTNDLDEASLMNLEDALLRSVLLTQKYSHNTKALVSRIETIISSLSESKNYHHRNVILLYLTQLVPIEENIIPIIQKTDPHMEKEFVSFYDYMMNKAEVEGLQKGIEKGIERGLEKGREEAKLELIFKAKEEGLSLSLISRLVNLPESAVKLILDSRKK